MLLRELPLNLALRMWDGMFAEDPSLGILDFVCVAMLLLIRNERECQLNYPTSVSLTNDPQSSGQTTPPSSPTSSTSLRRPTTIHSTQL